MGVVRLRAQLQPRRLTSINHLGLASGFARGFLIAAGIMLLALVIPAATIRIRRAGLAGVNPI
jgi:hypothetical protein